MVSTFCEVGKEGKQMDLNEKMELLGTDDLKLIQMYDDINFEMNGMLYEWIGYLDKMVEDDINLFSPILWELLGYEEQLEQSILKDKQMEKSLNEVFLQFENLEEVYKYLAEKVYPQYEDLGEPDPYGGSNEYNNIIENYILTLREFNIDEDDFLNYYYNIHLTQLTDETQILSVEEQIELSLLKDKLNQM